MKSNPNVNPNEVFIRYRSDILSSSFGISDIDIYADGNIWTKSLESGKTKQQISEEALEKLKEKLRDIDYMNLEKEYRNYSKNIRNNFNNHDL